MREVRPRIDWVGPVPDFFGTDSFAVSVGDTTVDVTVTVDVSVAAVADAPVAFEAGFTTLEDTRYDGTLSASDADGDTLSFSAAAPPAIGTVAIADDGSFTYTPAGNFNGADQFSFKANDGGLDSNIATVLINVGPANDPPVATNSTFEAHENTPLVETLLGYDIDAGDIVNFSIATAPTSGVAMIDDPATGTFTYTPNPGFIGGDSCTFAVTATSDATAPGVITINVIDPVPNWDFIGFANPWRPNYKVNAGSAIPLKWYYSDPVTGDLVDSSTPPAPEPQLEIRITGYPDCDLGAVPIEVVEDPGSSDLRYVSGEWQFNWDTGGLPEGCYELGIYHPVTNQLDRYSDGGAELNIQLK